MTINIADNNPRVSYSVGAGVTQTSFAVPFEFFDETDVLVYIGSTLKTLNTDYTVSGGDGTTGTITMSVTGPATVALVRDVTIERSTDFPTAGPFSVQSLNVELDKQIAIDADISDQIDRAVRSPIEEFTTMTLPDAATRADKLLKFDTAGNVAVESASALAAGAVVGANFVNNTFTGNGSQTAFTTTVEAGSKNNAQVYIDGVYQLKSSFSVSGLTLTFTEAPPLNSQIEVIIGNALDTIAGDAGNVDYNQGGTGAQTRTVESKLQDFVSVKDFGATGDGVTDDTAAIQSALDTGKNVHIPAGVYMHTGLTHTAYGQHVYGDGIKILPQPTYALGNATVLRKISGTGTNYTLGTHNGGLHDIAIDGNGLAGDGLLVTGHYLEIKNVALGEIGGTDYGMHLQSANLVNCDTLNFFGTYYGGIKATGTDACLYSSFSNVTIEATAGYGMDLDNVISTSFDNLLIENSIILRSGCAILTFNDLHTEYGGTAAPFVEIDQAIEISFRGLKFKQQAGLARTVPVFELTGTQQVSFYDGLIEDNSATSSPVVFSLSGTTYTVIDNVSYFGYASADFVDCPSAGGYNIDCSLENVRHYGTGSGTCNWKTAFSLNIESARNIYQTFSDVWTGGENATINMANVNGEIDTTNITSHSLVHLDSCVAVNDAANVAIMTNCKTTQGYRVDQGRHSFNALSVGTGATATWSNAIPQNAIIKSVVVKNNGAITGAAGFTGYDAGYTSDTDAFGTNTGSNNAELLPTDYTINTPLYNKEAGAADIILTANGANFASGIVNIYLNYDLVDSPV